MRYGLIFWYGCIGVIAFMTAIWGIKNGMEIDFLFVCIIGLIGYASIAINAFIKLIKDVRK